MKKWNWKSLSCVRSSTLAWKIPRAEEPGRLRPLGVAKSRTDWATSLSLFTFIHWRRQWQPTPGFLPGESQGRGSLVGCRLRGCTESDTTEATQQQQQQQLCLTLCDPLGVSPDQNTGVGSLCLFHGIFPTQGSKPGLPHCRQMLYPLSHRKALVKDFLYI